MPNYKIQDILSRISHMAMPINCSLNSEHIFLSRSHNQDISIFFLFFLKKSLVLV